MSKAMDLFNSRDDATIHGRVSKLRKSIFGIIGPMTLVVGSLTALPAAAEPGTWRPYRNTNFITSSRSSWKCTTTLPVGFNLYSQVCIVRSPSGRAIQGAVIVRNKNTFQYNTTANVAVINKGRNLSRAWECSESGVGAKSWSVCFGKTISWNYPAYASGGANGTWLGETGVSSP